MCKIIEDMCREERAEGYSEGQFEVALESVTALMDSLSVPADKAMDLLKIPANERGELLKKLLVKG